MGAPLRSVPEVEAQQAFDEQVIEDADLPLPVPRQGSRRRGGA